MLEIQDLTAGYGGKTVLRELSHTFPRGKLSVILGPNGCGKSTLLKAICGLLPGTTGAVVLDGLSLLPLSPQTRAQNLSYLPQSRQIPDITARRLVLHGRFPYLSYPRRYRQADLEAADRAMESLGILSLADTPLAEMSGGQRQKVYIAMALAQDTQAVLLDEPTAYLDIGHRLQLMQLARGLCSQGKTVITVLHDLTLALQYADEILVLNNGQAVCTGTPRVVLESGVLEQVFGVRIGRVQTDGVWNYYYQGEVI